jgi:hypothetical protein
VLGRRGLRPVRCVQTGSVADEAFFECASAVQPLGDADENERDVAGAEVARVRGGVAPVERRGEFAAVVDEFADEDEDAVLARDLATLSASARVPLFGTTSKSGAVIQRAPMSRHRGQPIRLPNRSIN